MSLTSEQIRAARAMLRMEQSVLAAKSGVSVETIRRFEKMDGEIRAQANTVASIKEALEHEGVVFVDAEGAEGEGVRTGTHPTHKMRNQIADWIWEFAAWRMSKELSNDLKLFERGPEHIAEFLAIELPHLIRENLPRNLREKSRPVLKRLQGKTEP